MLTYYQWSSLALTFEQFNSECLSYYSVKEFRKYTFKITATSPRDQWVNIGSGNGCQGWGQIRFIKYKYKYKYIFFWSFKYKYKYKYTGKNLIKYKYKYKYSSSNTNTNTNTQWGRDKIAAILQMTYWNLLYCKKIVYTFKFHWKLFPKVQSTISLHWFR